MKIEAAMPPISQRPDFKIEPGGKLEWRKSGLKVWIGTAWAMTYTVELKRVAAMGERYCVFRGGIASSDRFGSSAGLQDAKRIAQEDFDRRIAKLKADRL